MVLTTGQKTIVLKKYSNQGLGTVNLKSVCNLVNDRQNYDKLSSEMHKEANLNLVLSKPWLFQIKYF